MRKCSVLFSPRKTSINKCLHFHYYTLFVVVQIAMQLKIHFVNANFSGPRKHFV